MKRKYMKLSAVISLALCILIAMSAAVTAQPSIDTDESSVYTENEDKLAEAFDSAAGFAYSLLSGASTQPAASVGKAEVWFLFVNFRSEPKLSAENIITQFWIGREVKIESIDGLWAYVKDTETKEEGYIFKLFLRNKSSPISINREYDRVFAGQTREGRLSVSYSGDQKVTWSLSKEGIIDFDKSDLSFTGISPGTVTLTARAGSKRDSVTITCINEWEERETSKTVKEVSIKTSPGSSYKTEATVPAGTSVTAYGDLADGSDWIYVAANDAWGFIQLSDFPGIDYLMTEYHYYDKGYEKRFGSSESKILSYASVLNDVMMANFGLKVCSYVEPYTSAADKCKKWKYGDDYLNYLSGSCPKTENHSPDSCLRTIHMRDALLEDKGWGTDVITKAVWTGHIMDGHKPSNSEIVSQTLVFTTANTVSYSSETYSNKSPSNIRYYSLYEITHETGHQLGLNDGYCYKDIVNGTCSNKNCFTCRKLPLPNCIMAQIKSPTNSTNMFCDDCKEKINSHLKDHH